MNKALIYFILFILINVIFSADCNSQVSNSTITDSECRLLTVTDSKICIKGTDGCVDKTLCLKVETLEDPDTCSNYPADSDAYKCEVETQEDASKPCKQTQINCLAEDLLEEKISAEYCPKLKVNTEGKKACVKHDTDKKCIEISNCNEAKVGATDDICGSLVVSDSQKKKCIKEGNACVEKTLCNGAEGANDEACKTYYVSDSTTKKCVKKSNSNTCEEVNISEGEGENGDKKINLSFLILIGLLFI